MKCTFSYVSEQPLNLGRDHLPRELPKLQQMFTLPLHPPNPSITKKHLMATPTVFIRDSLPTDPPTREEYKHFSNGQQPHHIYFPTSGKAITFNLLFSRRTLHFHAVSVVVTFREAFVAFTECRNTFNGLFMLLCLVSFLGTYNYGNCHVERNR